MKLETHLLQGKKIQLHNLSDEVTATDGTNKGIWNFSGSINLNKEIIIGFSPTNYHTFFISGSCEYHTRFSFNRTTLRASRPSSIRAGFFIRIRGLNAKDLMYFRSDLERWAKRRTKSCVHGIFEIFKSSLGLEIVGLSEDATYLQDYVIPLLKNGLKSKDGFQPELGFYTTRDKNIQTMLKEMDEHSRSFDLALKASAALYHALRFVHWPELIPNKEYYENSSFENHLVLIRGY